VSGAERAWWLGDSRWPVAGAIALIGAAISAIGGAWVEAAVFFAAALALAIVTLLTVRR
jgi:hypothetical protein